ncbi:MULTISPECIES: TIGR04282 family arsenosugar biosynthesis glycosyltransferase [unclassified Arenibacter]|uniref:TIGR04282 family arsenosugar biosynthesis glycosyltransferase n=1 Tax=unclassified Arenibacter TaxID=2615047 RepID=UPI000E34287F|nr:MULTISPECIES: TIGR04282 family arsenosugar biosynthesis glycosyltransferase [unclassified Arenibacter]MCM4163837.1 glycosyltransferase [Arenibacter sp. A80]RFT56551.1 glycosyltransferase [Arenibacter sp. P308M17]
MTLPKDLLIIFTRNPELGKCKTRLAATVGNEIALNIYQFLLEHTKNITKGLVVGKWVFYSDEIWENDIWEQPIYEKKIQSGKDLGERMANAFKDGFNAGHEKIIIIGSDMYDLNESDLMEAFKILDQHDYVIGPAIDGGYYLLGMKVLNPALFKNKSWGADTVLEATLEDLKGKNYGLLAPKNDIDYFEDIKDIEIFRTFLKN